MTATNNNTQDDFGQKLAPLSKEEELAQAANELRVFNSGQNQMALYDSVTPAVEKSHRAILDISIALVVLVSLVQNIYAGWMVGSASGSWFAGVVEAFRNGNLQFVAIGAGGFIGAIILAMRIKARLNKNEEKIEELEKQEQKLNAIEMLAETKRIYSRPSGFWPALIISVFIFLPAVVVSMISGAAWLLSVVSVSSEVSPLVPLFESLGRMLGMNRGETQFAYSFFVIYSLEIAIFSYSMLRFILRTEGSRQKYRDMLDKIEDQKEEDYERSVQRSIKRQLETFKAASARRIAEHNERLKIEENELEQTERFKDDRDERRRLRRLAANRKEKKIAIMDYLNDDSVGAIARYWRNFKYHFLNALPGEIKAIGAVEKKS